VIWHSRWGVKFVRSHSHGLPRHRLGGQFLDGVEGKRFRYSSWIIEQRRRAQKVRVRTARVVKDGKVQRMVDEKYIRIGVIALRGEWGGWHDGTKTAAAS